MEDAIRAVPTLTFAGAKKVLAAAERAAFDAHLKVCIAVVDASGHLLALSRIDGAPPLSIRVAMDKARTAAETGQATSVFQDMVDGGKPSLITVAGLTSAKGGVPLLHGGVVIGGIGGSGESAEDDEMVAFAGAATLAAK